MDAEVRQRRRRLAACAGAALSVAIFCFVALGADESRGGPAGLLGDGAALSDTQRQEMAIILRRKEDMAIKAAEARIKARMQGREKGSHADVSSRGPQPETHSVPTPHDLLNKFERYAAEEHTLDSRMHATQDTINAINRPARKLEMQLKTLQRDGDLSHQPLAAGVVKDAKLQGAKERDAQQKEVQKTETEARIRELEKTADRERATAETDEAQVSQLKQAVNEDVEHNSKMQAQLWKEEETILLLQRALARDASLKEQLEAKDAELAQKTKKLDRLEEMAHGKTAKEAHAKPDSSHQLDMHEFKSFAAEQKAIVDDMHAHEQSTQNPGRAAKDEFKSFAQDEKDVVDDMHKVMAKTRKAIAETRRETSPGLILKHLHVNIPGVIARAGTAARLAGNGEHGEAGSHTNVPAGAAKDTAGSTLAATKADLEGEMQSIEKSEDAALSHIKKKMMNLDSIQTDGLDVNRLVTAAKEASYGGKARDSDSKAEILASVHENGQAAHKQVQPEAPKAHAGSASSRAHQVAHRRRSSKGGIRDDAIKTVEELARGNFPSPKPHAHYDAHAEEKQRPGPAEFAGVQKSSVQTSEKRAASTRKVTAVESPAEKSRPHAAAAQPPQSSKAVGGSESKQKLAESSRPAATAAAAHAAHAASAAKAPSTAPVTATARSAKLETSKGAGGSKDLASHAGKKVEKGVVASKKSASVAASTNAAASHGQISPLGEIDMALKAEKLFKKYGNGHDGSHAKSSPGGSHAKSSPGGGAARVAAPSHEKSKSAAKAKAASSSSDDDNTRSSHSSHSHSARRSHEINPLSVIDKAFAKAKEAHAAKLRAEVAHNKAELRAAAAAKREHADALKKLNAELGLGQAHAAHQKTQQLAVRTKASHSASELQHAAAGKTAVGGKGAGRAKADAPAQLSEPSEMDPLAVIDEALVKSKLHPQHAHADEKAAVKDDVVKPNSLEDLFGKKVAKHVGSLMDKVHRSEGRADLAKAAKKAAKPAKPQQRAEKMGEVQRLAKLIQKGKIEGDSSRNPVHKARMEKEVDTDDKSVRSSKGKATAKAVKLTTGQMEEAKDREAETDLEALYKKGLLVNHAHVHSSGAPTRQAGGGEDTQNTGVQRQRVPHTSKDQMAMEDLEKLHKAGLLRSKAARSAGADGGRAGSKAQEVR